MPNQRRTGVILGYANIIAKNLVNLVYTPMLLSFVGKADYGVFQTSYSFVFSLSLLSFGFSQAYVRFYMLKKADGDNEGIRKLNGVYLVLYAGVSAVAFFLGLGFAANSGTVFSGSFTPEQVDLAGRVMTILAASIALTLFNSVFDAYVIAREEFRFQQSRQLAATIAMPFLAYGLLLLGMGVVGVALVQLAVNAALLALNAFYAIGRLGMRFSVRRFDSALFRSVAAFSAWIFVNQVCDMVNQNIPNVALGAISGASAVAVFAVSVQIRNVFVSISTVMSNVFVPEINRIVAEADDNEKLVQLMTRVGRYQMILFCWVYGGFVLLGNFFVAKWAGESFADAYWLILAMALPLAVPLVQNTGTEIQRAKNLHKARSAVLLVMAALNVAFTIVASPQLGYWAPAIGYIASIVLGNGVFMNWYYHFRVGLDMTFFWRKVLPPACAAAVVVGLCAVAMRFAPMSDWASFFVWSAIYSILFGAAMWAAVLSKGEKAKAASLARLGKGACHGRQ